MTKTSQRLESHSHEALAEFLSWMGRHEGVEAFPVFDYVQLEVPDADGRHSIPGALNGVTVQWDIHDQLVYSSASERVESDEVEDFDVADDVVHPVAGGAVHVRPGQTIVVVHEGFAVEGVPTGASGDSE